jgi:PAS domain S-box-containing protein
MWELLDHLPSGVALFHLTDDADDESLTLVRQNKACRHMAGPGITDAEGRRLVEIFPTIPKEHVRLFADAARTGKVHEIEYSNREASVHFRVRAGGMSDQRVAVIFERPSALEEDARFIDAIVENIPNMVFVKEAKELRFRRFNRAGERLLGLDRRALLGKNDFDFFPEDQAQFFQQRDREALAAGAVVDIPEEPISTARGPRWLHTKKVPLVDAEGRPEYLLGISEDITDRKAAHEKERALVTQLEASNAELDAFTYSVSHDLRAPLRAIHGFAQMLVEDYGGKLDDEGRRVLGVITRSAVRMGQLIDDLLRFSHLGRAAVARDRVDMGALARACIAELDTKGRAIAFDLGALPAATGDAPLLKQVWVNLLGNAVKYTREAAQAQVHICGEVRDGHCVYRVSDNGVGFEPQYAGKLFGVFQRLHSPEQYEGTGVGLALVHRIVKKHGGWIRATARPGEGATFEFGIPSPP